MEKFSWSFNDGDEIWCNSADTVDECKADARAAIESGEEDESDTIYIGINESFTLCVDAESILEQIEEDASEFAGEIADDWDAFDYKTMKSELEELSERLTDVVNAWLKKNKREPNFYAVNNIKPYKIKIT